MKPEDPKDVPPDKTLQQVADELLKDIAAAYQENDPQKLAEYERREAEREAAMAEAIEEMRKEGKLPGLKGKKLPPKAG